MGVSKYIHGGHIRASLKAHKIRSTSAAARRLGSYRWSMVITNTKTGDVIASDSGWADHGKALDDAGRAVAAARLAWNYGFGKKVVG